MQKKFPIRPFRISSGDVLRFTQIDKLKHFAEQEKKEKFTFQTKWAQKGFCEKNFSA